MNFFPPPLRGQMWLFLADGSCIFRMSFTKPQNASHSPRPAPVNELRSTLPPQWTETVRGCQMINENHQRPEDQIVTVRSKNKIKIPLQIERRIGAGKCLSKSFSLIMRKTSEPRKAALPFPADAVIVSLENNKNIYNRNCNNNNHRVLVEFGMLVW